MNALTSIDFQGQKLFTTNLQGVIYTAIKPICENIGLHWRGQRERILRNEVLARSVRMIRTVAEDGKNREMLCLPLAYLNGWLFGVEINRVKKEIRPALRKYQEECFQVLHDYWHNGVAINPRPTSKDERTPLKNAVNMLVGKSSLNYSQAYRMVNQYMGTKSITEIDREDLPKAIEYVHSLILKIEPKQDVNNIDIAEVMQDMETIYNYNIKAITDLLNFSCKISNKYQLKVNK